MAMNARAISSVDSGLWDLLLAYLEWRMGKGAPKSARLPDPVYRWEFRGGAVVPVAMGFCTARSTKPHDPGILEVMGQVWNDLDEDQRICIIAAVKFQHEPWLKGQVWRKFLTWLDVTPRQYGMLLDNALLSLSGAARRRGLA